MRLYRLLPLALFCLVACGGKQTLVGKWNMTGAGTPTGSKFTMEFSEEGFMQTVDLKQGSVDLHVVGKGVYTLEGNKLVMTVTDVTFDEARVPTEVRDLVRQKVMQDKGKTQETEVKFENDTVQMISPGGTATLTRIK